MLKVSDLYLIKKETIVISCFEIGMLIAYWGSLNPWFLWPLGALYVIPAAFLVLVAFVVSGSMREPFFVRNDYLLLLSVYVFLAFYMSFAVGGNVNAFIGNLFHIILFLSLFMADKRVLFDLSTWISKGMACLLLVSIPVYLIFLVGVPLPSVNVQYEEGLYSYSNYFFFLLDDRSIFIFPRFHSVFLEPGHLGTATVLLLFAQSGYWKRWYNVVLWVATLMTFSLAAYVLSLVIIFLNLWMHGKQVVKGICAIVCCVGVGVTSAFFYNDGDNLVHDLILLRLEVNDEGELSGDKNPTEMAIPMKTSFKELKQEVSYIVYPVISSPFLNSLINKNEISLKQHAVNINIGKSDREILIEFYKATGGDNWKNNTNWCTDAPLSVWYGIQTDNEGRVTSISLPDNGLINEANLTGLSKLEYLNVNENQLVSLNVSGLNTLSDLYCFNNLLKVLDLSNTVGLTNLNCSSNKLTDINISGLNKLEKFRCVNNELTSLDVSGLNRLKTFDCSSNKLASLDVSNLTNLSDLDCRSNPLISLNTNGCINLEELCSRGYGSVDRDPNLSDLDVSHLVNLVHLNIHCSGITTLNVSGLKKLTKLECSNNKIAELDVSESTSLEYLNCEYNQISVLNVGKLPNLNVLLCGHNQITRLDIAESVNLTNLSCSSNQITELNAAGLVNLISLACSNNQITKLDVSKLVKLEILYCNTNQITNLDVAELVSLKELLCWNNLLTSLDVSNSIYLEKLDCSFNQLTSLNASGSNRLTSLDIDDNPIRILDISGADNLNDFRISYNEEICPTEKVYLSSSQENLKSKFKLWGNRNYNIYQEPNHRYGFQYPEFIYK